MSPEQAQEQYVALLNSLVEEWRKWRPGKELRVVDSHAAKSPTDGRLDRIESRLVALEALQIQREHPLTFQARLWNWCLRWFGPMIVYLILWKLGAWRKRIKSN